MFDIIRLRYGTNARLKRGRIRGISIIKKRMRAKITPPIPPLKKEEGAIMIPGALIDKKWDCAVVFAGFTLPCTANARR